MDFSKVITIEDDESYLRQISKDVKKDDPKLEDNIKYISEFCKENEVLAMASVQLGIPKKLIYIKSTKEDSFLLEHVEDEAIVMINPEIIEEEGESIYWECCASCMDNMGLVRRPYKVKVRYLDAGFNEKEEVLEGFKATVFSHEYDHLFGILHIDIAEKLMVMPVDERHVFRQKEENKYKVLRKTGKYKHPLR